MFVLQGVIQNYAWGKHGKSSEVARLISSVDDTIVIDENVPYAELWMGSHPKGMSTIPETKESLADYIKKNPDSLGKNFTNLFDSVDNLPFLLKVLSVELALSIQIHPNKKDAAFLHKSKPNHYPDINHKPEMAIAMTPFEALCGFRPKKEIIDFLKDIDILREIVGQEIVDKLNLDNGILIDKLFIKNIFTALMTCDSLKMKGYVESLADKIKTDEKLLTENVYKIFLKLHEQFPGDVGCFCVFFLNYIILEPSQALYLQPNIPHAYISGDCIECMACSDNVIRAGLTPKFRDVETLCNLVDCTPKTEKEILFASEKDLSDEYLTIYDPPIPEFTVAKIELPGTVENYDLAGLDGASIILVIQGEITVTSKDKSDMKSLSLKAGSIIFIAANKKISIVNKLSDKMTIMYRAYCIV